MTRMGGLGWGRNREQKEEEGENGGRGWGGRREDGAGGGGIEGGEGGEEEVEVREGVEGKGRGQGSHSRVLQDYSSSSQHSEIITLPHRGLPSPAVSHPIQSKDFDLDSNSILNTSRRIFFSSANYGFKYYWLRCHGSSNEVEMLIISSPGVKDEERTRKE